MATKTLILRPTSVTAPDESLITLYPSDTAMADAHALIGEEIADDASTYIQCANNSTINYHFNFIKPDDFKEITNISFFMRYGGTNNNGSSNIALQMGLASTNYSLGTLALSGSAYVDSFGTIADIDKTNIIAKLNNATLSLDFYVQQTVSSANKVSVPQVTQVYIEVTYENNKNSTLYMKQNGEWVLYNYEIYHKRNCKWNIPNFSTLQSNTKLTSKEVE